MSRPCQRHYHNLLLFDVLRFYMALLLDDLRIYGSASVFVNLIVLNNLSTLKAGTEREDTWH